MKALEFTVDGVAVYLDVAADLAMGDLSEDMDAISTQIGWYGRCLAAARRALDDATDAAKYDVARTMESEFARNPKVGVDKARTAAESRRDYLDHRKRVAAARELVGTLDAAYTALQTKADILRSKGALARSELGADGMHVTEPNDPPRPRSRDRDKDDRQRGMAEVMRRGRRRGGEEEEADET